MQTDAWTRAKVTSAPTKRSLKITIAMLPSQWHVLVLTLVGQPFGRVGQSA